MKYRSFIFPAEWLTDREKEELGIKQDQDESERRENDKPLKS